MISFYIFVITYIIERNAELVKKKFVRIKIINNKFSIFHLRFLGIYEFIIIDLFRGTLKNSGGILINYLYNFVYSIENELKFNILLGFLYRGADKNRKKRDSNYRMIAKKYEFESFLNNIILDYNILVKII
jgi:hypothetical protein